jgi:hypothetical protein
MGQVPRITWTRITWTSITCKTNHHLATHHQNGVKAMGGIKKGWS